MSTRVARVFAFGFGIGLGAVLGVSVVLAGTSGPAEHQIARRVEATTTAVRQQSQARAVATAAAKATQTAESHARTSALCAESRGAQVEASLVGEPGISYTAYAAAGTVRNICGHPLEVKLHVLALTRDGTTHNAIVDDHPMKLAPGERRAFNYPLGRFPNDGIGELYVVPTIHQP
ncbi:MAG TPA: hypothetical protein VMP10_02345 [Chloroflexota bacterium]|nr:hypothetical protein [Chloroflexota bacterium]